MKITTIGMLLLAIWLIVSGVLIFVPEIGFAALPKILAGLGIAAGVCILINK